MKILKLTSLFLFVFFITACDDDDNTINTPEQDPTGVTLSLQPTDIVQAVLIDPEDNANMSVEDDLLPLFDATVEANGGEFIASFTTHFVGEGNFTPQQFRIYKWTNGADVLAFQADGNQGQIVALTETGLRNFSIGYGNPITPVEYTFRTDRIYEIFSGDIANFDLLAGFFPVQEIGNTQFGRNEFLSLQGSAEVQGNWVFQIGGLVEWPSDEVFFDFVNTTAFREGIVEFRDPALDNLILINGDYEPNR